MSILPPPINYSSLQILNPPLSASSAKPPTSCWLVQWLELDSCQALSWRLVAILSPDPKGVGNFLFSLPLEPGDLIILQSTMLEFSLEIYFAKSFDSGSCWLRLWLACFLLFERLVFWIFGILDFWNFISPSPFSCKSAYYLTSCFSLFCVGTCAEELLLAFVSVETFPKCYY